MPAPASTNETSGNGVINQRPEKLADLLTEGEVNENWVLANQKQPRFFVANLEQVISELPVGYTKIGHFFLEAALAIEKETSWSEQFNSEYYSSLTQISPDKRFKPKYIGTAATIIVALEIACRELQPDINVYDSLRIVPAHFFIDLWTRDRLNELRSRYVKLTADEQQAMSSDRKHYEKFDALALNEIGQPASKELLDQLTAGYCATQNVCQALTSFVEEHFPADLHVGPVRASGDPCVYVEELGRKRAAPALRIPRFVDVPVSS